uniref:Chloroplast protein-transporting ATPase n=1 Tax=Panagrolaimus sp. PS1159 TaxID=55785 RepID=A0AC35G1W5_9BILA
MSQVKNEKDAISVRDSLRLLVEYNAPLNSLPNNIQNGGGDSSKWPKKIQQNLIKNRFPDVSNELSIERLIDLVFAENVKGVVNMTEKELIEIYNQVMDELSTISDYNLSKLEAILKSPQTSPGFCTRLAYIIQFVWLHYNKKCRAAQILAVILAYNKPSQRSRVLQINTGEGKTLIIAMFAILKAMDLHKIDIITTSFELAMHQSFQMERLYASFNLTSSFNCHADKELNKKAYKCDIIYATISELKHHTLLDIMDKSENYKSGRECDFAIVDEVDSVMVDNSLAVLYISNSVPGMFHLLHILGAIWAQIQQISNIVVQINGEWYEQREEEEYIIDEPIENFYKHLTLDYMKKLLRIEVPTEKTFPHLKYPKFLKYFVEAQLSRWVDSAIDAQLYYRLGYHYVLHEEKVTVVEAGSTGSLSLNSQWGNGLHQFLQMKHGCKVTAENLVSNYMSNITYLQRYGTNLIGLTGTVGGEDDRELMNKAYNVDCVILPPFKEKRHIEFPPILGMNRADWLNKVVESVSKKLDYGQAALVLAHYIQEAEDIADMLQIKHGPKVKRYTKNSESHVPGRELKSGEVIVATNIAGRGTDIELTDEVENSGGLHVCVTFLPKNCRVEKQNIGRTSRTGNRGTSQFVILYEDANHDPTAVLHALREQRDANVKKSILETMKRIDVAKEKDVFFRRFCDLKDIIEKEANDVKKPFIKEAINEWFGYWILHKEKLQMSEFEEYEKMCRKNSNETIIKNPFILVQLSVKYIGEKKYQEANDFLSKAIEMDPEITANAYYWRGFCKVALYNKNVKKRSIIDEAIDDFRKARKIISSNHQENLYLIITGHKAESVILQDEVNRYRVLYSIIVNSINNAVGQDVEEEINDLEKALDNTELTGEQKQPLRERRNDLAKNRVELENGELIKARKNKNQVSMESQDFEKFLPAEEKNYLYEDAISVIRRNGFYFVFIFNEKPSIKWWNVIGLAILGFVQLIAGAAVIVFSAGTATNIGMSLMAEGAFDLVAAVKDGIINKSFNWANWAIQKAISLAISVISAGFSAIKNAASGAARAVKTAANFAKPGVEQAAKAGARTSGGLIIKEVTKIGAKKLIAEPIIDNVLSNTIEEPLQKRLKDTINEIIIQHLKDDPNVQKLIKCDQKAGNFKYAKKLEEKVLGFLDQKRNVYHQLGRDICRQLEGRIKGTSGKILTAILKMGRYAEVVKVITDVLKNLPKCVKEIANSKECEQDYNNKEEKSSAKITLHEFCQHISQRASTAIISTMMGTLTHKLSSFAIDKAFKSVDEHVNKKVQEFQKNHAGVNGKYEELDTKLVRKLRIPALKLEKNIDTIKNGGPAGITHVEACAHAVGREIIVLHGSEQPVKFGSSNSNLPPIVLRFEQGNKGEVGHYTLANGKKVQQSGKNSCLFDAVAAETGINADELRYQTASVMTNNYRKFAEAELRNQYDTRQGGKPSDSFKKHIYPPDVSHNYSDGRSSYSADEKAVDLFEKNVEKNVRRPVIIRNRKNQKEFQSKGQPRTTLYVNDFDEKLKEEFNKRFDDLKKRKLVQESQRSTYKMNLQIIGKAKGRDRMSVGGDLSSPRDIWVENPTFIVKGGESVHFKWNDPETRIYERKSFMNGGPRTHYKGDLLPGLKIQ